MSGVKHTPGDYSVHPNAGGGLNIMVAHERKAGTAFVTIASTHAVRNPLHLHGREPIEEAEAAANGLLFAAAPKLLEALERLAGFLCGETLSDEDRREAYHIADAAIAKATGGEA